MDPFFIRSYPPPPSVRGVRPRNWPQPVRTPYTYFQSPSPRTAVLRFYLDYSSEMAIESAVKAV